MSNYSHHKKSVTNASRIISRILETESDTVRPVHTDLALKDNLAIFFKDSASDCFYHQKCALEEDNMGTISYFCSIGVILIKRS